MARTRDIGAWHARRVRAASALLVGALTLGAPSVAGADSASVGITARVNGPAFSLTVLTDGLVDFGSAVKGTVTTSPLEPILRVESTIPWNFTDDSDPTVLLGSAPVARDTVVRHAPSLPFGTGISPGVYTVSSAYTLDLTSPEVQALPTGTQVSTTFRYTAVQQ